MCMKSWYATCLPKTQWCRHSLIKWVHRVHHEVSEWGHIQKWITRQCDWACFPNQTWTYTPRKKRHLASLRISHHHHHHHHHHHNNHHHHHHNNNNKIGACAPGCHFQISRKALAKAIWSSAAGSSACCTAPSRPSFNGQHRSRFHVATVVFFYVLLMALI